MTTQVRADELVKLLRPEFGNASISGGGGTALTEGPGIDIASNAIGLGGDTILIYHANGNPVDEEPATEAGLIAAIGAANSGDIIELPIVTIAGDHTIPAGVHVYGISCFSTILTGQITGSASASLENCSIIRSASDANAVYGVAAPATGTFYLSRIHISAAQAGAGNAAAIYSNAGGDVEAWNCSLLAPAGGGGWHYGVYMDVGGNLVYIEAGVCIGATGATNWSP